MRALLFKCISAWCLVLSVNSWIGSCVYTSVSMCCTATRTTETQWLVKTRRSLLELPRAMPFPSNPIRSHLYIASPNPPISSVP